MTKKTDGYQDTPIKKHWDSYTQEELRDIAQHWRAVAHLRLHKLQAIELLDPELLSVNRTRCAGGMKCPLIKNLDSLPWDYLYEEGEDGYGPEAGEGDEDRGAASSGGPDEADAGADDKGDGPGNEADGNADDAGWNEREV